MNKKGQDKKKQTKIITTILGFILGSILLLCLIFFLLSDRFFPGISVSGVDISFTSYAGAAAKLEKRLASKNNQTLTFTYQESTQSSSLQTFSLNPALLIESFDTKPALDQAFSFGHSKFYSQPVDINLKPKFNENFSKEIDKIAQSVNREAVNSEVKIDNNEILVTPDQHGMALDTDKLRDVLTNYINQKNPPLEYTLPVKKVAPKLSYQSALNIKRSLDQIKIQPLKLRFQDKTWVLSLDDVLGMIDFNNTKPTIASADILNQNYNLLSVSYGTEIINDAVLTLDEEKIKAFLKPIASEINQPLKEPLFSFDGQKVTQFQPPQEGRELDIEKTTQMISLSLTGSKSQDINLPVSSIQPLNKLTNELGIKELIGGGTSHFAGSIPNRIYNINLAASRINGILIPPGQEFSFVNTVGDITAATGYKQAYVIKSGRTVLDDGGGVCQVSTTLFRAVLNAGLPITARTAHAYRVGYYEQGFPPGLDATVFYPSVDFKFKNDTSHHILIQAEARGLTLDINLYGTSDGRISTITKPVITNQTPPPAEVRQEDPTLPKGTVKQVDFAAWGATVLFSRTVTKDGIAKTDNFRSNYRPWQAVYLVGTQ